MLVAVVEMRSHTVAAQHEAHMVEALTSRRIRMVPPVRVIGVTI